MAGGCLILCILIQVLLITTANKGQTEISINCPNQYWNGGKPLTLTCNVTCYANNGCSAEYYTWNNTDNADFRCKEKKHTTTEGKSHTFNCTIENATWKQDTTFKFFVQMTTGPKSTTFKVTIVPPADPTESPNPESRTDESGRSNTVAVAVIVILCLATVVGVLFMKYNASILALCSRKTITEANIV